MFIMQKTSILERGYGFVKHLLTLTSVLQRIQSPSINLTTLSISRDFLLPSESKSIDIFLNRRELSLIHQFQLHLKIILFS